MEAPDYSAIITVRASSNSVLCSSQHKGELQEPSTVASVVAYNSERDPSVACMPNSVAVGDPATCDERHDLGCHLGQSATHKPPSLFIHRQELSQLHQHPCSGNEYGLKSTIACEYSLSTKRASLAGSIVCAKSTDAIALVYDLWDEMDSEIFTVLYSMQSGKKKLFITLL